MPKPPANGIASDTPPSGAAEPPIGSRSTGLNDKLPRAAPWFDALKDGRLASAKSSSTSPLRSRWVGTLCLLVTAVGWGINWPVLKVLLREWPPLSARGWAGVTAALGLGLVAVVRGQSLAVPRHARGRLLVAAGINVAAWMGFATLCMLWLSVAEAALLVYTMPIWAMLLAWPVLGERPTAKGVIALTLGIAGVGVLLTGRGGLAIGPEKLPGVLFALGAAVLFALGAVTSRSPLPIPPLVSVAWQVGLGCLPMALAGLLFERPDPSALTFGGWAAMAYMAVVSMGLCYLSWFAALRRLPAATASMATLLSPLIGVVLAALALGEPLGMREGLALGLTFSGLALALRKA